MDFNESKESLKQAYIELGMELVDEHPDELFFKINELKYKISEEDIEEFKDSQNFIKDNDIIEVAGGMCGLKYCELRIEPISTNRLPLFIRNFDNGIFFGDSTSDNVYVEINRASKHFVNFFRFKPIELPRLPLFRKRYYQKENIDDFRDLRDEIRTPLVIRIFNIPEITVEKSLIFSISLAESCLFELTYLNNVSFKLLDNTSTDVALKIMKFLNNERSKENQFDLPSVKFNSDLLKFYQLGCSSNIPILQFLAFYQILEYFFITVSEEELYKKILQRLNDPKFKKDESNLGKLIKEVEDYNKTNDEKEMLKQVITKYVNENDLIEFIKSYEMFLDNKIYSKKQKRFGIEQQVNLEKGHVIGNCSAIIKTVRNALVHSSDRYEKNERFIPFSQSTEIVIQEIPLIKYLAERVIIGSAY